MNPPYHVVRYLLNKNNNNPAILFRRYPQFNVNRAPNVTSYLHYACIKHHVQCIRSLVKCGAKLTTKNNCGFTPLYLICWYPSKKHLPNQSNWQVPLHELLKWIFVYDDIRKTINWHDNIFRLTPLHIALSEGVGIETIRLLLDNGADPTICDHQGHKPSHRTKNLAIKQLLKSFELKYLLQDVGEWRPWKHTKYPVSYRKVMTTLVILAKCYKKNLYRLIVHNIIQQLKAHSSDGL